MAPETRQRRADRRRRTLDKLRDVIDLTADTSEATTPDATTLDAIDLTANTPKSTNLTADAFEAIGLTAYNLDLTAEDSWDMKDGEIDFGSVFWGGLERRAEDEIEREFWTLFGGESFHHLYVPPIDLT